MPDTGFLFLSLLSVGVGACLFLAPGALAKASDRLNRSIGKLDDALIRHRYVVGVLAFVAGYAFFKLALLLPSLR
jgi:hypothetical protein